MTLNRRSDFGPGGVQRDMAVYVFESLKEGSLLRPQRGAHGGGGGGCQPEQLEQHRRRLWRRGARADRNRCQRFPKICAQKAAVSRGRLSVSGQVAHLPSCRCSPRLGFLPTSSPLKCPRRKEPRSKCVKGCDIPIAQPQLSAPPQPGRACDNWRTAARFHSTRVHRQEWLSLPKILGGAFPSGAWM